MVSRRSRPTVLLSALCLLVSAGSCGTLPAPAPKTTTTSALCKPDALAACENAITRARGEAQETQALLDAYADARLSRDAQDPWANLWRKAKSAGGVKHALVLEAMDGAAPTLGTKAFLIQTKTLPPVSVPNEALLAAIGEAIGLETIVVVRGKPEEVRFVFPHDPLRPFMAGATPFVRDDQTIGRIDAELALSDSVRRAVGHASLFRYVEAAKEAETLRAALQDLPLESETAMRGRYLLTLLENAGIALEPETSPNTLIQNQERPQTTPQEKATVYGDLLRVRASKDEKEAWKSLGPQIQQGLPEDKRAGLAALYGQDTSCIEAPPPNFDEAEDLVFAWGLGRTLAPAIGGETAKGTLSLEAWLPRYEALVREVDSAQTTWAHAFPLAQQRGEISGLSLATTPTWKRTETLLSAHLAALGQLEDVYPTRLRTLSIVTLAYAPGLVADTTLRSSLVDLMRSSVEGRIARAKDASAVFEAAVAGTLAASTYPPAIQSAFYSALFSAFRDKLAKDMSRQTGWDVAGLFVADVLVRVLLGEKPDLDASADQVSRALSEEGLSQKPLAKLAASGARYLALGSAHALDPEASNPAHFPAPRKAALEALREAIAGLADPKEPLPQGLLDDVTTLGDQTITLLATTWLDKPQPTAGVCAANASGPTPAARRVLARIGDVRRKILASPSYTKGKGLGIRRLHLVVTLLSDAIDLAARPDKEKPVTFTIPVAEAEADVEAALGEWQEKPLADALTAVYGISRGVLGEKPAKGAPAIDTKRLGKLVSALALLFKDEKTGASIALLDALSRAGHPEADKPTQGGLGAMLVGYAKSLREQGKPDQSDLCLLGAMLVSVVAEKPPPEDAIAATEAMGSELGWVLKFAREVHGARNGKTPDPSTYGEGMKKVVADACEDPGIALDMIAVMNTLRMASEGSRSKAASSLDELLAKGESQGIRIPRMSYRYEEKTVSKVFTLSLDMSLGAGLIEGSSSFQLGLGVRSPAKPEGSFVAHLAPVQTPEREAEAGRYYVHGRAIAAAWHFLAGENELGAKDAAKAIDAAVFGARLGGKAVGPADPKTMAADARGMLAVTAVLAADAGMPLLAGDLWSLVRSTLDDTTNDRAIADILATPPIALASMPDTAPLVDRAARALRVVGEPLVCTEKKVELGSFEAPSCDMYALALSLRAGGALHRLPRLRRGETGRACSGPLPALDAFLASVEQQTYDAEAFTRAVLELSAAGRTYDAAILLARQRRSSQCNPALLAAARSIGRSPALGPSLRADVLSVAVNCAPLDDVVLGDIASLDAETSTVADRSRNLALIVFAAEIGRARDRWDVLAKLVESPTFVSRWLDTTPQASLVATTLAYAASVLAKDDSLAIKASKPYELFCVTLPASDPGLCSIIASLTKQNEPVEARNKAAREAIDSVLQRVSRGRDRR